MKVMVLIPPSKFARNVARDLVYGCWCKGKRIAGIQFPPISQLTLVTVLREAGHDAHLLDAAALGLSVEAVEERITEGFDAAFVLTSTMTIKEDSGVLAQLKQARPGLWTGVWGSQPTFMPNGTLLRDGIDFIVKRESEFVIRDLVTALERRDGSHRDVRGIGYMDGDAPVVTSPYPFISDLDVLPIPDRDLLPEDVDYFNPIVKRLPFTTMFTTRGCPAKCTFCQSPPFYGDRVRFQSAKRVVDEMQVIEKQGYKEIFFRDEIFTASKKRVREICRLILERGIKLSWICSSRVDTADREMLVLMKQAGCHLVRFGVESGVNEILRNIKKGATVGQIRRAFGWVHEIGIDTHAHMMIGMPGETEETIETTIRFVKEIAPTVVTFGICTPYPGTPLFDEVAAVHPEIGDGGELDLATLHSKSFYNEVYTTLSAEQLSRTIRRVYREFYMRPGYIFKWLRRLGSLDEFRRVSLAATQVFDFVLRGDAPPATDD